MYELCWRLSDLNFFFYVWERGFIKRRMCYHLQLWFVLRKWWDGFISCFTYWICNAIIVIYNVIMYVFSFIPRFFVAFFKKLYFVSFYFVIRQYLSFLIYKCNLIDSFLFFWEERLNIFPECIVSVILLEYRLSFV